MVFANVRGYSISDAMISTAAVAVGLAVLRAFAGLDPSALLIGVPMAVGAALAAISAMSRALGRRAAWELRNPRLGAIAWVGILLADAAVVLWCVVRWFL